MDFPLYHVGLAAGRNGLWHVVVIVQEWTTVDYVAKTETNPLAFLAQLTVV